LTLNFNTPLKPAPLLSLLHKKAGCTKPGCMFKHEEKITFLLSSAIAGEMILFVCPLMLQQ
jgi:hypothetical protein